MWKEGIDCELSIWVDNLGDYVTPTLQPHLINN